ncbi:hypothetical protein RclHR1_00400011 [Rhizophagus clarus]|uniref:Uncharacterized protein n=1 Tax=Rhizophagus clarus TaxID=94130 RepID=A0A2Z6S8S8_9GLOM|nr:hypothetical protein RclHR1_00400011 [Rhizophagus clarus]GES84030.1 hypothetical protein GLOIN_2v1572471 [Rhizophagus clarus]
MIIFRSRIILFVLYTLYFVSKSTGVELRIRDESSTISNISTRPASLIIEIIIGIVIAIIGICLGIFFSFHCLKKRGHIYPESKKSRAFRAIPKGEITSTSKQLKVPQYDNSTKHEQIVIKQHGPAIDISESDDIPDSLFYPATQTIYESKHASTSMINLPPSQQPNLSLSGGSPSGGQEMTRSLSG